MARPLATYGEDLTGQLLVEGSNDFHVLCSLFAKRKVPKNTFGIKEKGSYEELRDGLDVELDVPHVDTIGIIVDADENLDSRWEELTELLESLGYADIPDQPSPTGCIFTAGRKRLGIWLMPDNQVAGILENFVALLIGEKDKPLWQHAQQSIESIPEGLKQFRQSRLAKAHMYTWLAWQKEPGIPMGRAIMERYLDAESPHADPFINWIKNLFHLHPESSTQ